MVVVVSDEEGINCGNYDNKIRDIVNKNVTDLLVQVVQCRYFVEM